MNKYPVVVCKQCGKQFETQVKIDPKVYSICPTLVVGDNTFTCPYCKEQAGYTENDFLYTQQQASELASFGKIVEAVINVVNTSEDPLHTAREILGELEKAKVENDISILTKSSKLAFLSKWIPDSPEKLAAYIVILTTISQILTKEPAKPIEYKTVIIQIQ